MELDFDEKIKICAEEMASDYHISERTARRIIGDLDLEDIVFEYYEDTINEKANEKEEKIKEEYQMNKDLYEGDIHGGI